MNGIIIVNKETNQTSRDVVNQLSDFFSFKQIGHAGTLDPLATGVLILCFGSATKLCEMLTNHDKEYVATMKLGIKTDTYDREGKIISQTNVNFTDEEIIDALNHFVGKYEQEVPIYSAVKINGKKLYEYARENKEVTLPKRIVDIMNIELISIENNLVKFKCMVSKGTYIRSLINDIGNYLGCGAMMMELIRTKQGDYHLNDASTISQIKEDKYKLITIKELLSDYPHQNVNDEKLAKIYNGAIIEKDFDSKYLVYCYNDEPIAIYYEYEKDSTKAKPYKML